MLEKVAVGFCYRTMSPSEFAVRLIQVWSEVPEVQRGGLIYVPYRHWLHEARNQMVRDFLGTDAQALLMIDTDMLFTPADVRRLVSLDEMVVAGAYSFDLGRLDAAVKTEEGILTLISDPLPEEPGLVDFAGTGFMMIKREVFEEIAKEEGEHWFDHLTLPDGTWLWEDWSFCERARDAGFKIALDPTVVLGHLKDVVLTPGRTVAEA